MNSGRSGQAAVEGLIAAALLVVLLTAGGFLSLGPLAVFFVEDAMEEALLCATYRSPRECQGTFERKTRRGILGRWIRDSRLNCGAETCRLVVRWTWPRPLPATSVRSFSRVIR